MADQFVGSVIGVGDGARTGYSLRVTDTVACCIVGVGKRVLMGACAIVDVGSRQTAQRVIRVRRFLARLIHHLRTQVVGRVGIRVAYQRSNI